jgi:predicted RNA-binding protein with PIN domain
MTRWLVDGMNVIGSRPTGWWRDRPGAMRGLAEELARFAQDSGDEVAVIFDGKPFELEVSGVEVAFASRRGPNAADDDIAERVAADPMPADIRVVTSDATLAKRARHAGAEVMGAGEFRRKLDELDSVP